MSPSRNCWRSAVSSSRPERSPGVLLGPQKMLAPVVGLSLGLLPLGYIWFCRKQRLNKFAKQLPDALELVGRSLRAGHSLSSGLRMVSDEMTAPIGPEFQRAFEEQNLGVPLEEALSNLSDRVDSLDRAVLCDGRDPATANRW